MSSVAPIHAQKPLTEFTIFNELPVELRLMIWNMAAQGRLVVWGRYMPKNEDFGALQACRESRGELLHKYKRFHYHGPGWPSFPDSATKRYGPPKLINYDTDIFGWQYDMSALATEANVRRVLGRFDPKADMLRKLIRPVQHLLIHLDLKACFSNRIPGSLAATTPSNWDDLQELQRIWDHHDYQGKRLKGARRWKVIKNHFPVLREISVAFRAGISEAFIEGIERDELETTNYKVSTGQNRIERLAIMNIKVEFGKGQKEGWIKKDLVLSFMGEA